MFDDFAYRGCRVRAGVRQRGGEGRGKWFGIISVVQGADESLLCLSDQLFDWPAAARRHAVGYAKRLIDARLDAAGGAPRVADGRMRSGPQDSLSGEAAAA